MALGLQQGGFEADAPITIFNIDTFRPAFTPPPPSERADGYLEVFVGSGSNWSFVEDDGTARDRVARTTEKVPISDLCSTGLYHFARLDDFRDAMAAERASPTSSEYYVAPLYNRLIARGRDIRYRRIDRADVIFCGVPQEYEALRAQGFGAAAERSDRLAESPIG